MKNALGQALHDAGTPDELPALINAHGTGTRANDQAETSALAEVFQETGGLTVVSTKGLTGHTLGAAGGIEAVLLLMALRNGTTPGTVGCKEVDPDFVLLPMAGGISRSLERRWGISESLAFGGGNSALVLEAV